jgi:hypothetical protein
MQHYWAITHNLINPARFKVTTWNNRGFIGTADDPATVSIGWMSNGKSANLGEDFGNRGKASDSRPSRLTASEEWVGMAIAKGGGDELSGEI